MRKLLFGALLAAAPVSIIAAEAHGVWKTESTDAGDYVEVTVGPCESDAAKTCGKITRAVTKDGQTRTTSNWAS